MNFMASFSALPADVRMRMLREQAERMLREQAPGFACEAPPGEPEQLSLPIEDKPEP
ncbi:MAG: hypothetical protein ACREQD_11715 [Candidatus Binataceae bacterium]